MVAAPQFTVVGKPIPRVEGPDKVRGRAQYTADVLLPGTLWAQNVRSPHPHARIVAIDTTRARRVPGVRAVLTAADIANRRIGRRLKDYPVLCDDRVRFVGDKVAAVAAEDPEAAAEAASLVDVTYEELPAVFDPLEAMAPGAPVLHPEAHAYEGWSEEIPRDAVNVCAYQEWVRGDVAAGMAAADLVVEHTFRTPLVHQGYLEPHAALVAIGQTGRVEVWASNKVPFNLKRELATIIDRPERDILVHTITVGGDFGSKGSPADVPMAYYLARHTGRPVKFVASSPEDLSAASPRHPSVVTLRTGLRRDGTIVARWARVVFNTGAYGSFKPSANGMLGGAGRAGGSYVIPNLHIEGYCVYTNQVPCGYMRAPGSPQVLFAVEAHTDLLARELGMDPVEFRLRNLPTHTADGRPHMAAQVIRAAAEAVGKGQGARGGGGATGSRQLDSDAGPFPSHRESGEVKGLIGWGLALAERGTGVGTGSSDLTVNPDGTITAVTGIPDNGTGGLTSVAQIVAEAFGVSFERVQLVRGDTDAVAIDAESGASRMTNAAGHAALLAAAKIQEQLAPLAASMLGATAAQWERRGWRGDNGGFVSLEDLALEMIKAGEERAHAQVTYTTPRSPDLAYCVQAAEVEVDPETGQVVVHRMVNALDAGTIINEIGHQSQIEGSLVQGLGFALMEDLAFDQGRVTAMNLGDYKEPVIADVPPLTTVILPGAGPGPFDARSIGELPHIPTAGAIANAVADAIGAPIFELPITAERVLAARAARTRNS